MSDYVIEAERLTRYFGQKCAVDGVSFRLPRGTVTALLGRNGSGKTTLMRMLMGMLEPTRGRSTVLGEDSLALTPAARGRIAYIAEGHPIYGWLSIRELARHQAYFYPSWNWKLFHRILDHFQLDESARAGRLSRGQTAGVSLAIALAPEPELLVLDDPSLGLDPVARRAILEVIVDLCTEAPRTVLLSTHELQDVERIADRVLVLDQSVLVADAEKDFFLDHIREFVVDAGPVAEGEAPPPIKGLISSRRDGPLRRFLVAHPEPGVAQQLSDLGAEIEERRVNLEDAVIGYLSRRGAVLSNRKAGA